MWLRRSVMISLLIGWAFACLASAAQGSLRAHRLAPATAAESAPNGFSSVAVFAFNSIEIRKQTRVEGDVVVNTASLGPTLEPGFEIGLDASVAVVGDVRADSVHLDRGAAVSGAIHCHELADSNNPPGSCAALGLPVFDPLPVFHEALVRAGAPDVLVGPGETVTLLPDQSWGDITIAPGGTLVFGGGTFDVRSIGPAATAGNPCPFPCRSVTFAAASEVRVEGRLDIGKEAYLGPATGSGLGASDILIYIGGANGGDGSPEALPAAAWVGQASVVAANLYAARGTLSLDKATTVSGALLGRDVRVNTESRITLDSFFVNRPPVAFPQTVSTRGAGSITLTLEGRDPENEDLTFSIISGPLEGTLSALAPVVPPPVEDRENPGQFLQPPVTHATVTYTPDVPGESREDHFTFQVADPAGGTGMAVVTINPPGDPTTPVPIDEITASPAFAETFRGMEVEVPLTAGLPAQVSVTFAIVSTPSFGSLGPVAQRPPSGAVVTYTPDPGFTGEDSFVFEACGLVGESEQCSTATATVTVAEPQVVAEPQTLETAQGVPVVITLGGTPGSSFPLPGAAVVTPIAGRAAFLDPAEVAGNVADADSDGLGDNHNDLPGTTPVLMAAAVDGEGGPGSNGVMRLEIEWDVSGSVSAGELQSAQVILSTVKGTVDSLGTFFFVGTGQQDGQLTDSDFEAPAEAVADVVMPVPEGPVGSEGTFSFDVTALLRRILEQDLGSFSIQGRVDERLAGAGFQRGLQVRTTAASNQASFLQPQLAITTPGVVAPPLSFSIVHLPTHGTLLDAFQTPIVAVPARLPNERVTYAPDAEFRGIDTFTFQVEDSFTSTSATAVITLLVQFVPVGSCEEDDTFCDDGRP